MIFVKKTALLLAIILMLFLPLTAQAAMPEDVHPLALKIFPGLSFDGTIAKCSATVIADNMSDNITVTNVTVSTYNNMWQATSK